MSDDIQDVLWQQFEIEVSEHLDSLESDLASPEEAAAPAKVAAIFRALHSTKGLGAAMGVSSMETLAHAAESLFASVRDGSRALDAAVAESVLQAVDALRSMATSAVESRGDVEGRPDLVEQLYTASQSGPTAVRTQDEETTDSDDEALVELADRLSAAMAVLVAALSPGGSEESLQELDDELLALDEAVGPIGLQGLRRHLRQLSRAMRRDGPDDALLRDLATALGTVEELAGRPAGRQELMSHISQRGAGHLLRTCALAAESVLDGGDTAGAAEALSAAAAQAELLDLDNSATVLTLAGDLLSRGAPDDAMRERIGRIVDRIGEAAAANPPADLSPEDAARFREALRASQQAQGAADIVERARGLGVHEQVLAHPSDEMIAKLRSVLEDPNLLLVEFDANLEADSELAARISAWIRDNAEPVASAVIGSGADQRTRLLVASAARPAAVKADMNAVDPSHAHLVVHICDGQEAEAAQEQALQRVEEVVRVPAHAIDDLLDRLSELMPVSAALEMLSEEAPHQRLARTLNRLGLDSSDDLAALEADLADREDRIRLIAEELGRVLRGLRDATMDLRVVPVETLFNRFPRVARDLARSQGKDIRFSVEGNDARIDKGMIERLVDPLMHMVRNAVDHGVEMPDVREAGGKARHAELTLRSEQQGEHVLVELSDDGAGIDAQRLRAKAVDRGLLSRSQADELSDDAAIRLIFESGFPVCCRRRSERSLSFPLPKTRDSHSAPMCRSENHPIHVRDYMIRAHPTI